MGKYCTVCGMATLRMEGICDDCVKKGHKPGVVGITRRSHF